MTRTTIALAIAAAIAAASAPALAQQKKTMLTLETAKKMTQACIDKATEMGWKMNIAILDDGGNLKHFVRMDGAFLGSIQISQLKANTSASFPFSTKQVGDIVQTRVPGLAFVPGLVTFEGGLPIITGGGEHIGAIGVSGAKSDEDGVCAQAALDAVKDDLK